MRPTLVFIAAVALIAGVSAQTASQAASTAASAQVPQQCITGGLQIQQACGPELQQQLKAQGINVNINDIGSLVSAFSGAQGSGRAQSIASSWKPSSGCCKAACEFTRNLCGCNSAVVNLVGGALGGNSGSIASLLTQFSNNCSPSFPALSQANGNCPATASFTC